MSVVPRVLSAPGIRGNEAPPGAPVIQVSGAARLLPRLLTGKTYQPLGRCFVGAGGCLPAGCCEVLLASAISFST